MVRGMAIQTYERLTITFPDGSTAIYPPVSQVIVTDGSDDSQQFVASQIARGYPVSVDGPLDLGALAALVTPADAARCALCGTPEPPDAYALGWRSQTCDTPSDFHALVCPTCQQGDGDRLDHAR